MDCAGVSSAGGLRARPLIPESLHSCCGGRRAEPSRIYSGEGRAGIHSALRNSANLRRLHDWAVERGGDLGPVIFIRDGLRNDRQARTVPG